MYYIDSLMFILSASRLVSYGGDEDDDANKVKVSLVNMSKMQCYSPTDIFGMSVSIPNNIE